MGVIAKSLKKVIDGNFISPVIVKHSPGLGRDVLANLPRINSILTLSRFKMFSFVARPDDIDKISKISGVETVYLDGKIKIPEMPDISLLDLGIETRIRDLLSKLRTRKLTQNENANSVPTSITRKLLGADKATSEGFSGQGVTVGIVDTGGSQTFQLHPQVRERITLLSSRGIPNDTNGHGTHVATTIFGKEATTRTAKNKPVIVHGMSPGVTPILIKSLFTPVGFGSDSSVMKSIDIALKMGVSVINMSLGSSPDPNIPANAENDPLVAAVEQLPDDIIMVVASGNDGAPILGSPASAKNTISVGAIDSRNNKVALFSNRGVDFIAPGVDILSGVQTGTLVDVVGKGSPGFATISGTSMATPHMTGMVALAKQFYQEKLGIKLTWQDVLAIGKKLGETKTSERGYGLFTWDMIKQSISERIS